MIRREREVKDISKIAEILTQCGVLRIGIADGNKVYVVPVNFGFTLCDGKLCLYFHGAKSGRKYSLLSREKKVPVGFEADCRHKLITGETPCSYTFKYASVIGEGTACLVEEKEDKKRALDVIMGHYSKKQGFEYDEAVLEKTAVFKITSESFSCKENV